MYYVSCCMQYTYRYLTIKLVLYMYTYCMALDLEYVQFSNHLFYYYSIFILLQLTFYILHRRQPHFISRHLECLLSRSNEIGNFFLPCYRTYVKFYPYQIMFYMNEHFFLPLFLASMNISFVM